MSSLILLKSMLLPKVTKMTKRKKNCNAQKSSIIKPSFRIKNKLMCRICNEEKGEVLLFDNSLQPNICEEIKYFSGVTINKMENLSSYICQNCLNLLNGCIMFREMCQRNNHNQMNVSIKIETPDFPAIESDKFGDESNESYSMPSPSFSETGPETWNCGLCVKEFYDLTSYTSHLCELPKPKQPKGEAAVEHKKKVYLCDICGKTATTISSLHIHMNIHDNNFPFKCEVCPYQGRTLDLLRVHKRSHLADKPYKCTQCGKATTTSSNLAKHMRHVHSNTRPYKCQYCERAFSYQHDVKRHVKDIHLRQGTVECDICNKKFNTKKILQGHKVKIHKIRGIRHGRLPSYLQCRQDVPAHEQTADNNVQQLQHEENITC